MSYVIACVSNIKFGSVGKDRGEKVTFKITKQARTIPRGSPMNFLGIEHESKNYD